MKRNPEKKIRVGKNSSLDSEKNLIEELTRLIEISKQSLAIQANSVLSILFWRIGKRINDEILNYRRADYGKQIVSTVSTQLEMRFGKNFNERNVRRMIQFSDQFTDYELVVQWSKRLSWSHIIELLPLRKIEAKLFYAEKVALEGWGVRELRSNIAGKVFERTSIADIQMQKITSTNSSIFKDPYFLDFLGLNPIYSENDLEQAILNELEKFILEIGRGFAFVERQKRMIIDGEDFYLDLLFYHRGLNRLVAIELKLGKFQAKHKGQMDLYLRWLNKYEKKTGEKEPVGLILCAESSREQIELLEMHKDGIVVAEYWTELPPKKELEKRLHLILWEAKERFERKKLL